MYKLCCEPRLCGTLQSPHGPFSSSSARLNSVRPLTPQFRVSAFTHAPLFSFAWLFIASLIPTFTLASLLPTISSTSATSFFYFEFRNAFYVHRLPTRTWLTCYLGQHASLKSNPNLSAEMDQRPNNFIFIHFIHFLFHFFNSPPGE